LKDDDDDDDDDDDSSLYVSNLMSRRFLSFE